MDLAAILARIAELAALDPAEVDPAELDELRTQLIAASEERAETGDADSVAELEQIADGLESVGAIQTAHVTAENERRARADAALERIRASQADPDEGEETESAPPAEGEEAPALVPAMAAAAAPATTPRISRVAARRPQSRQPRQEAPAQTPGVYNLVASGGIQGIEAGEPIRDAEKLGAAFAGMWQATQGWRSGRANLRVAGTSVEFPDERTLGRDSRQNAERIAAVTGPQALAAAGGICAPVPIQYDLPTLGSDARPVRDQMLARFGADRGGVTLLPPPTMADVTGAVSLWTEANDVEPTDPTTKPCLEFTCPEEYTETVDAIVTCLKFGNFRARYFPEQIEAWTRLTAVWGARYAETRMLTTIGSLSTAVTIGAGGNSDLGTARTILAGIERVAAAYRNRHRIARTAPLRFGAPEWLLANMRTDMLREIPGSSEERMAVADATLEAWFRVRNINPTFFLDGETGQIFGAQPDGHAIAWPTSVVTYLYSEGDFLFLDGGELNLGLVRDSTLNATNKVTLFSETFEDVMFHGVEAFRVSIDICPSGATAAPIDFNPCTTGS